MNGDSTAPADDGRPLVAAATTNRPLWIFGGFALVSAALLFGALESRRSARDAASALPSGGDTSQVIAAPPELAIPPDYGAYNAPQPWWQLAPRPATPLPPVPVRIIREAPRYLPPPPQSVYPAPAAAPVPAVVYRAADPASSTRPEANDAISGEAVKTGNRTLAAHFANPSVTVPQGTVIQAVMETALDSSRAGFARAIVSRDVRGFDGTKVLIPRGSRLLGNYRADLAQGQSRAFVQWERLMRPDGVVIAVNSPAADPLGRAGIGGKVNTHFFQRFGGALLQSTLDLGVGLASRSLSGGNVVVALPGSAVQSSAQSLVPQDIKPTLKTRQGASVSVFVARDLDFSTVDQ